jgi:hypothetical protein
MKKLTYVAALTAILFGAAALAESENRVEIRVATDNDGTHEATEIHLAGAAMDFDMHEMQVGESRSVIDEAGRSIMITRLEDGFEFNVDGKKIEVPAMNGNFMHMVSNETADVEMLALGDHDMVMSGGHSMTMVDADDGIFIISGATLDASTKESIRAVLQSAGHDVEVQFMDSGAHNGERHVKVIKKQVVAE